jgi:NADH-quinone oxidoreductase subunit G
LSNLQSALIVGSNLRKDHPLFAQRIRQAAKKGCKVFAINDRVYDWALPVNASVVAAGDWAQALADVAAAVAEAKGVRLPWPVRP